MWSFFDAKEITLPLELDTDFANCWGKMVPVTRNDATQKCNRGLTIFYAQAGLRDFINSIEQMRAVYACIYSFIDLVSSSVCMVTIIAGKWRRKRKRFGMLIRKMENIGTFIQHKWFGLNEHLCVCAKD